MLFKIRKILLSPYYTFFIFLLAATTYMLGDGALIACMLFEAALVALVLVLSDDLSPTLFPALSLIVQGTTLIGRIEILTPYIPYALILFPALIAHLILYRRSFTLGVTLNGVVVTALSILFSGLGNRENTDYRDPTTIYYTLAMSVGLVLLYFLFAFAVKRRSEHDRMQRFLMTLCYVGALCAVIIIYNFLKWFLGYAGGSHVDFYYDLIPYRNTIANLLTLCMPAPFFFAGYAMKRPFAHVGMFLVGCLFYSAMLMTVARTAMLFGTVVLIVCLVYYLRGKEEWYFKFTSILIVLIGLSVVSVSFYEPILDLFSSRLENGLASLNEPRWLLFLRSITDFLEHPIFGIGFASTQNADIYHADACISWYHLYFPQIWGSLGLLGCLAFGYQLVLRAKLAFYKPTAETVAIALCYLGLLLYSQTDPGEFVPIPFAALGILMFVLLEHRYESLEKPTATSPRRFLLLPKSTPSTVKEDAPSEKDGERS